MSASAIFYEQNNDENLLAKILLLQNLFAPMDTCMEKTILIVLIDNFLLRLSSNEHSPVHIPLQLLNEVMFFLAVGFFKQKIRLES